MRLYSTNPERLRKAPNLDRICYNGSKRDVYISHKTFGVDLEL